MISIPELKRALCIPATDTSRHTDIAAVERAAVAFMERETGRHFGEPTEFVERLNGATADTLWLKEIPLEDPAILVETLGGTTWTETDAADYETDGTKLIMVNGYWAEGNRNIRATYTAGYEAGQEPPDVREAVKQIAVAMWKAQKSSGMKSESIGGYSYTREDMTKLPGVRETIWHWRRVRV